eukprot:7162267-Alexandrium_andersonii.AAC.1
MCIRDRLSAVSPRVSRSSPDALQRLFGGSPEALRSSPEALWGSPELSGSSPELSRGSLDLTAALR